MAERLVFVGILPGLVGLDPGDEVAWHSDTGTLRIEFDPRRSPFSSNVFQAPAGARLLSGPIRAGTNPGSYKYRLFLNDQLIGHGEIFVRSK